MSKVKKDPKINVQTVVDTIHWNLSTNIEDTIQYLQSLKADADERGVQLKLNYTKDYGTYGDSDRDVIELVEERLETDAEYEKRLSDAEEHQKQVQAQKVAQFEALKKELGK